MIPAPSPTSLPLTIALDGPAAAGKSTVGRAVADRLGYLYFDTGALYRALTWLALRCGVVPDDGEGLAELCRSHRLTVAARAADPGYGVLVDGAEVTAELRSPEVDRAVSPVSAHAAVRDALLAAQRQPAAEGPVVMVGRDIGTVVLPDADLKLYLDASPEARAWRRWHELQAAGMATDYASELEAMRMRDARDAGRSVAPLQVSPTAVVVDTDRCDLDQVVAHVLDLIARWPDPLTRNGGQAPCVAGLLPEGVARADADGALGAEGEGIGGGDGDGLISYDRNGVIGAVGNRAPGAIGHGATGAVAKGVS